MKIIITALVLISLSSDSNAQTTEVIRLPAVPTAVTNFTPGTLKISLAPVVSIEVTLVNETTGRTEFFEYPCVATPLLPNGCAVNTTDKVKTFIQTLNTANLSTKSLWNRIMDRLLIDFPGRFPSGAVVQ